MLVQELYQDSLTCEETSLAHYLHHLLSEKKLSLEDPVSKIDFNQADHQKVAEMIENNVLAIQKIRIYSLKKNHHEFVSVFARSQKEATQFYTNTLQQVPVNCHEYSLDFQLARGREFISFRDMRKEFWIFPVMAGYFLKEKM